MESAPPLHRWLGSAAVALQLLAFHRSTPAAEGCEYARFVSRDTRLLLWVEDRDAFLRRTRRTAIEQAVRSAGITLDEIGAADAARQLSALVPDVALQALPDLLSRGRGSMALSIEGFVLESGVPRPDALALADVAGFEGLLPALRDLAEGKPAAAAVRNFRLPFEVAAEPPPVAHSHRGTAIVEFRTMAGDRVAMCESAGVLMAARSPQLLMKALDRAADPSVGNLAASDRFAETWRALDPKPGALVAYANLRRMRQEEAFLLLSGTAARALVMEGLRDFDGVGLAVRGVGEEFAARVFLEKGAGRRGADSMLLRESAPFQYARLLDQRALAALAVRADAALAGGLLAAAADLAGGMRTRVSAEQAIEKLGGARKLQPLLDQLGGELALFQPEIRTGEFAPRLGFLFDVRDGAAVERWFESQPRAVIRPQHAHGQKCFELLLANNGYLSAPAFAVVGDRLYGANSFLSLRDLIDPKFADLGRLVDSEHFRAPFDRIDLDPAAPASGQLFLASPILARDYSVWAVALLQGAAMRRLAADDRDFLANLGAMLDDPDVQDALRGVAVTAATREDGVLLELVGP